MTEITADLVLRAYTIGYFPMAENRRDTNLFWVCPEQRGIIPLDAVHIPRKMRAELRDPKWMVTCNRDFAGVIDGCAESTPKRTDTWISPPIRHLFLELHQMGHAHSIEVWDTTSSSANPPLVGGLYGVSLGAAFFGESMFSRAENASKIALLNLIARLQHSGFELLDTQFITKHLQQFGAIEISRDEYLDKLEQAIQKPAAFYTADDPNRQLFMELLQSKTVTS